MPNTIALTPGLYDAEEDTGFASTADSGIGLSDRRRPGRRVGRVNPALMPLLRGPFSPVPDGPDAMEEWADRAPGRGLVIGVAVSVVLWVCGIVALVYALA